MTRFSWWGALVVLSVMAGYVSAADSTDVKELLERMKKMEAKLAEQEKTISDLRAGNATKATAAQQVDKALSNSSAGAIFHDPEIHKRPIKVGGNLDVTYQYAFNQPTTGINNERVMDPKDNNDFNVHLARLYFDGTAKEKCQAGFFIDLMFGSDANLAEQVGPDNALTVDSRHASDPQTGSANDDDFTLLQAYVDYILPVGNGLRMKVGKFATPIGYEVAFAQDNWNATRSFQFGKSEPISHTGIGFEYKVYSNWQVNGYLVNGWDLMRDNNEGKTGIVQSIWSPYKWLTWQVSGVVGNEVARNEAATYYNYYTAPTGNDRADEDTTYLINTYLTFSPWEKWDFAVEASWGLTENGNLNDAKDNSVSPTGYNTFGSRRTPDAQWWVVDAYMKYKFLPGWYVATRGEYFNDAGASRTWYGTTFHGKQELYSGTATLSYTPVNPFEIRLEYRYDASSRDAFAAKQLGTATHSMDGNPLDFVKHQDTITLQFLYKF